MLQCDIPMGRPLPWTGVRLLNEDGFAVSMGEVGEIVAELADPVDGLNQKRVFRDATSKCQHFTGDLGYQLADGNIYFAGRRDGKMKINGFRVELDEIEAVAEVIPGVERTFATLSDDGLLLFVHTGSEGMAQATVKATGNDVIDRSASLFDLCTDNLSTIEARIEL